VELRTGEKSDEGGRREGGKYRRTRGEGREIERSMDSITPAARHFLCITLRDLCRQ
jgi:hypothetical protein